MFAATIASLAFLYKAKQPLWRAIFATLTGLGLVVLGYIDKILGYQYGIYRREHEWYVSHFFLGIAAAWLMIFSLAIIQEIYKDRSNRWRNIHIILNCVALILFLGQGITGSRDLLEIPLSWQKDYVYKCDGANKTCPNPAPLGGQK
jgi:O-antigen ligase